MMVVLIRLEVIEPVKDVMEGVPEMKESVAKQGVVNPISVRAMQGHYRIMDGRKRVASCRALGHEVIPAIVHNVTDVQEAELLLYH